ncbi:MAG TPA: cyclic nucleotide-binding domain-containing protein [Verrucomicrobiales bacterium]|nr:cyclic nucleotide-binding domain-containing protein [Verrucomicrobiales bacterium]
MNSLPECFRNLPKQRLDPDHVLIQEGVPCRTMYILELGAVEILKGSMRITTIDTPGSVFGEISTLLNEAPIGSVRVLEPTLLSVINDPRTFLIQNPEVALYVATVLARRVKAVTEFLKDAREGAAAAPTRADMDDMLDSFAKRVFDLPRF